MGGAVIFAIAVVLGWASWAQAPEQAQASTPQTEQQPASSPQQEKPKKPGIFSKQHLKEHFSSGCVNAPLNRCWGTSQKLSPQKGPAEGRPEGGDTTTAQNTEPPRPGGEVSSSKETKIDLSPPPGDSNREPGSGGGDVSEFHAYDPHRAEKNVEVGTFYFKKGNYRAAISRFREALQFKPHDALATFGLAQSLEKVGELDNARNSYESYLKILPRGPSAVEARAALERLNGAKQPQASPPGKR